MNKKFNILVTGGAGYIGSVLVPILLSQRYHVIVCDNFRYNQTSLLDVSYDKNLEIVRGNAADESIIKPLIAKADVILPLACLTGAQICNYYPDEAKVVNLEAIKLILKLRSRRQRIIFPNTNSGYGIGQRSILCTEETPLRPITLYGKLKVEAEKRVIAAGGSISLRLATVFGISPRMRLDLLVNDFVWRAQKDRFLVIFEGHFKRNFIHVRDVALAFIHAIANFERMKNEAYNVGLSNANLSKIELCYEIKKQIADFYFVEAKVGKDPDRRNYIVSNEKIEKTGFKPKISIPAGIFELIKGYRVFSRGLFRNI